MGVFATMLVLAACNQTGARSVGLGIAADLDPTGFSREAVDLAESVPTVQEPGAREIDYSKFASRLADVAAGNTARPNYLSELDRHNSMMMAMQTAGITQSVAHAAIGGALSNGVSLVGAIPSLANQAVSAGMLADRMAQVRAQSSAAAARLEAERAAEQIVSDVDRPAEAQAVLSILDGTRASSASWYNPQTGSSGKVSLSPVNRTMPKVMDCRIIKRELRSGRTTRKGEMLACRSNGEWYDVS
ncbi:hypothetical protein [Microvirga mediterraneensis]|uniref:Surface antigen n=1 Tax=Microvirga mediterraneensis TaxID=2754695 RepID=A0A838BK97_9HYPH|nr:hypothetical protein [Microvirga mediterraneensis]MBA1155529.1 hypothetical protein [Microvirga mediterraneensis]